MRNPSVRKKSKFYNYKK